MDGWVLLPYGYDPSETYPGVLTIHGGPRTVYGPTFYHEMQALAGAGFFVFFCNPEGSSGCGNAFGDLRGKYGTIDYEDIMAFTDAVLETYPQIDSKRLAVIGGSYGGFMVNWVNGPTTDQYQQKIRLSAGQNQTKGLDLKIRTVKSSSI